MGNLIYLAFFSLLFIPSSSQTIVGTWKSVDDQTGQDKSLVKIYKAKNGMYYGKITKLLFKPEGAPSNPTCVKCPKNDYRHKKPIKGLVILSKLKASKDLKSADSGKVLNPETGNIYNCKITLIDNGRKLKMRGYIGIPAMGRTQIWSRVK
jgi:uncharacterized protein (DUF2147 family)